MSTPEVNRLIAAFQESDLECPEFMSRLEEYEKEYGESVYGNMEKYIPSANREMLSVLLTAIVAGERFCDGCIAEAISNGSLSAILFRLKEIALLEALED